MGGPTGQLKACANVCTAESAQPEYYFGLRKNLSHHKNQSSKFLLKFGQNFQTKIAAPKITLFVWAEVWIFLRKRQPHAFSRAR